MQKVNVTESDIKDLASLRMILRQERFQIRPPREKQEGVNKGRECAITGRTSKSTLKRDKIECHGVSWPTRKKRGAL